MAANSCSHTKIERVDSGTEWCKNCGAYRTIDIEGDYSYWRSPKLATTTGIKKHQWDVNKMQSLFKERDNYYRRVKALEAQLEVAGPCALCEECHVYVCEEEPCELVPTRGDDGLLKCPEFKNVEEAG